MKLKNCFKYGKRVDIEYILEKLFGFDKVFVHLNPDFEVDEKRFEKVIELYKEGYPLEYIFNEVFFYGEKFYIEEGVLIPRDDTEPLIDIAKKELKGVNKPLIAEIGVGSGVISIMLKKLFPSYQFIATDINPIALEVTKKNLKLHNVEIDLYLTNLLDNVVQKIDVIISNPPYVEEEWKNDNLKFEPKEAIFAKDSGTALLKEIVKEGIRRDVKMIICEMGYNQKELMEKFFESLNLQNYYFYKDLAGNYRGFVIKKECCFAE
jgi:release factor glutamine methyltransferase